MKRLIALSVFFLVQSVWLMAQDISAGMVTAFRKGNVQEMKAFLGEEVELSIDGRFLSTKKGDAEAHLAAFFSEQGVAGFVMNHQGKRGESGFMVGTLQTRKGKFRVNCFYKKVSSVYLIYQIRIDKTNG